MESGAWTAVPLQPRAQGAGQEPAELDSKEPTADIADYMYNEIRFRALKASGPERAAQLLEVARRDAKERYAFYKYLADRPGQARARIR